MSRRVSVFVLAATVAAGLACGSGDATTASVEPAVEEAASAPATPYSGRFASDPKLTDLDVAAIPASELKLLRNEIFARHGRPFTTPEMQAHFAAQPWYKADPAYQDGVLTANDKANADLIASFEESPKDLVAVHELTGSSLITFTDATHATVDPSGGLYEEAARVVMYETRGKWLFTHDTESDVNATLWEMNFADKSVRDAGVFARPSP